MATRAFSAAASTPRAWRSIRVPAICWWPTSTGRCCTHTALQPDNNGRNGQNVRIVVFDNDWFSPTYGTSTEQYAYQLEAQSDVAARIIAAGGTASGTDPRQGRNIGLSAIIALNHHEFLVLERDNRGIGVENPKGENKVGTKRIYKNVDFNGNFAKCPIDEVTLCQINDLGPFSEAPPPDHSLLPGLLHAYRASADDLAGYVKPRSFWFRWFGRHHWFDDDDCDD